MRHFIYGLVSWFMVPIALWQGIGVRRRVPRMAPPVGDPFGTFGDKDPGIRLLVIGDSSAAGVGVEHMHEGLGSNLARILHERTGQSVVWRQAGANSATTEQIRDYVAPYLADQDFTHIVITAGTNDMKNFLPKRRFKRGFGGLLYTIDTIWPRAMTVWSPIIDMRTVPALPTALAHILELRVKLMNDMGRELCAERRAHAAPQLRTDGVEGFAIDGFHASAFGYSYWANHLADFILDEDRPSTSS